MNNKVLHLFLSINFDILDLEKKLRKLSEENIYHINIILLISTVKSSYDIPIEEKKNVLSQIEQTISSIEQLPTIPTKDENLAAKFSSILASTKKDFINLYKNVDASYISELFTKIQNILVNLKKDSNHTFILFPEIKELHTLESFSSYYHVLIKKQKLVLISSDIDLLSTTELAEKKKKTVEKPVKTTGKEKIKNK